MQLGDIIDKLECNHGYFPREVVEEAGYQQAALTPVFLELLERAAAQPKTVIEKGDNYLLHIYAMYFLATWRETTAFAPIIRLFSVDTETSYALAGEFDCQDLHRVLASVYSGDLAALDSVVRDLSVSEYVRGSVMEVLLHLYAERTMPREQVVNQYQQWLLFYLSRGERYDFATSHLASVICDIHPQELYGGVKLAYERQLVDPGYMEWTWVERSNNQSLESVLELLKPPRYGYITNVAEQMEWWACFNEVISANRDTPAKMPTPPVPYDQGQLETYVREDPKVGRNDPCPCGSGKKYKKCCLI